MKNYQLKGVLLIGLILFGVPYCYQAVPAEPKDMTPAGSDLAQLERISQDMDGHIHQGEVSAFKTYQGSVPAQEDMEEMVTRRIVFIGSLMEMRLR